MKRICCIFVLCFLVSASVLPAEDFWEKKEFTSWDEDETQEILEDSPWAKKTRSKVDNKNPMKNTDMGPGRGGMGGGRGGMGGGMGGMGGGMGGMGGGMGGMGGGQEGMGGIPGPLVTLRWQSALPVKLAVVRHNYGDDIKSSKEAIASIHRESTHILGVTGLNGQAENYSAELIIENSYLKTGDTEIKPTQVIPSQDGPGQVSLFIVFPKYDDEGKPLFTVENKNIEVVITAWRYDIKKKFGLKDMVFRGALDF